MRETEITSSQYWNKKIDEAVAEPDPALSNFRVTLVHHELAKVLTELIGSDGGPNFHSWAVWGSRKAGVTIRQEDLESAIHNATWVSGIVGAIVGIVTSIWIRSNIKLPWGSTIIASILGSICGGATGRQIAISSRREASKLILHGNRIVLEDIGKKTAQFIQNFHDNQSYNEKSLNKFLSSFRPGTTEQGGQELLRSAFTNYYKARFETDLKRKHELMYLANCQAVLHEHFRLQPIIAASMPFIVRKCSTQRMMTFDVGSRQLSVSHDVPSLGNAVFPETLQNISNPELIEFLYGKNGWNVQIETLRNTGAKDWTKIRERMGYIVNLFRSLHLDSGLSIQPYSEDQIEKFQAGKLSRV